MTHHETINEIFRRLADAPNGVDCDVNQVLSATGRLVSAILMASYKELDERQQVVDWFVGNLVASTDPTRSAQQRQSLN